MYDVGDRVNVFGVFTNSTGTVVDPTAITLEWQVDNGDVTTLTFGTDAELTKNSTGNYQAYIDPSAGGTYEYRWVGTGTAIAAEEGSFHVRAKKVV